MTPAAAADLSRFAAEGEGITAWRRLAWAGCAAAERAVHLWRRGLGRAGIPASAPAAGSDFVAYRVRFAPTLAETAVHWANHRLASRYRNAIDAAH